MQANEKIRIGVYDPRAVAVAYTHSRAFQMQLEAKQKELQKARSGKDRIRVRELDSWGKSLQIRRHFQGFAGAPVDDILSEVKDRLPGIAALCHVQAISPKPDFTDPDIVVTDITAELVKIWSPDKATLEIISRLKQTPPLAIEKLAGMRPEF